MRNQENRNIEHKQQFNGWAKSRNVEVSPELPGVDLKVGQIVTFINDYEVKFPGMEVLGFKVTPFYDRCVYISSDSYWFPVRPDQLKSE